MMTITVGVALQGFGRFALARMYMKTERVINEVQGRAPGQVADGNRSGNGASRRGRVEEDSERPSLLKLNGLSSSIGDVIFQRRLFRMLPEHTILSEYTISQSPKMATRIASVELRIGTESCRTGNGRGCCSILTLILCCCFLSTKHENRIKRFTFRLPWTQERTEAVFGSRPCLLRIFVDADSVL